MRRGVVPGAALVTGAGRRIGRALALTLARSGHDVAVHHRRSPEAAAEVAAEIAALGRRGAVVQADLSQPDEIAPLVAAAAEAFGPLTLLVNNASVFEDDRVGDVEAQAWSRQMQTNLYAPIALAQAFAAQVPASAAHGEAMVLNLLDQRVLKPNPQFFTYGLTKSALWTATRTLAQALAPRVRVNGIGPGPTLASSHQDEAAFAAEAAATPLARGVDLDDICDAALYLVGARAVTGQMIAVDSGQHLAWRTPDIAGP